MVAVLGISKRSVFEIEEESPVHQLIMKTRVQLSPRILARLVILDRRSGRLIRCERSSESTEGFAGKSMRNRALVDGIRGWQ